MSKPLSNCCNAPMQTEGETTKFLYCSKCSQPCDPKKPPYDRAGLENYGKVIKVTPKLRRQAEKVSKIFDEERLQRVVKASNRDQKAVMDNAEIMKELVENQMEIDKAFDEGKKSKSMQIDEWMN